MATESSDNDGCFGRIGLGSILAVIVSYSTNHSILWAIFHGWLSWLYLLYYVFINDTFYTELNFFPDFKDSILTFFAESTEFKLNLVKSLSGESAKTFSDVIYEFKDNLAKGLSGQSAK